MQSECRVREMFVRESQGLTMEWKEDRHFVCEKTCSFFSILTVKCIHFRRRDTNPLHIKEIQGDRMAIILTLMLLRDITIPSGQQNLNLVFFYFSSSRQTNWLEWMTRTERFFSFCHVSLSYLVLLRGWIERSLSFPIEFVCLSMSFDRNPWKMVSFHFASHIP